MTIALEPWGGGDLELLRAWNTPQMTEHLGGPESDDKVIARNQKYITFSAAGEAGINVILVDGERAGGVNFCSTGEAYEMGWAVLPRFHGRGVATTAVLLALEQARAKHLFRYVHALPRVTNGASNGVCRKTGFMLAGTAEFEYPPGVFALSNDWVYDLDTPLN